ncbi:MAG: ABC transporter substrate-binding protein [Pseudomonadota bacterium]
MRTVLRATLLFILFLGAATAHAELPAGYRLILQTENFPPFNMAKSGKNFARDENIQGLSATTVREMFKRADIPYTLTLRFPWDRIYKQTLEQPNHGLFSTSRSEAREKLFKWVGPIAQYESVLLAAPGKPMKLDSLEQAKAYKVGAYKSSAVSQLLEGKGLTPVNSLRDQENISKLISGRIDLWATSDPVWRYYAKQEGVSGLETVLSFHTSSLYLALNIDTPDEVVERLQKALDQMKSEGFNSCSQNPDLC